MAYGTVAGFRSFALPTAALANIDDPQIQSFLDLSQDLIDSYLRNQYRLPLVVVPTSIARAVYIICAYDLLVWRGFNPESVDSSFSARYESTIKWLEGIASGRVMLAKEVDQTSDYDGRPRVHTSSTRRGW